MILIIKRCWDREKHVGHPGDSLGHLLVLPCLVLMKDEQGHKPWPEKGMMGRSSDPPGMRAWVR